MRMHNWSPEGAKTAPLVRYLLELAPAGTLLHIDTEQVAHHMRFTNLKTVSAELGALQEAGALRYWAEKCSRDIAVRVTSPQGHETVV